MNFQVFGCPRCQQPFQVASSQSVQMVQCPSCAQTVEVPAQTAAAVPIPEQLAYSCPKCHGQFGVTNEMFGQKVGCPHCQESVVIQSPAGAGDSPAGPVIVTDKAKKKKNKKSKERWKSHTKLESPTPAESEVAKNPNESAKSSSGGSATAETFVPPIKPKRRGPPSKSIKEKDQSADRPAGDKQIERDLLPPKGKRQAAQRSPTQPPESPPTKKARGGKKSKVKPIDRAQSTKSTNPIDSDEKRRDESGETKSEPTTIESKTKSAGVVESVESESIDSSATTSERKPLASIDHLLPPRFDVTDPCRIGLDTGKNQFKVVLPDGQGGTRQLDQRLVRVEHGGEKISLVAMTTREKRRRRIIQNTIAVVIGIIIIAVAFSLLR